MTEHQTKAFFDDLLQNVLPQGDYSRLSEFYTNDVVGHQNNQVFYLDDIKKRCKLLHKHHAAFSFKIENFVTFDEFVTLVVRQQWLEKEDKEYYEAVITAVYRMRNNKVCELWILADRPLDTYQEYNANFKRGSRLFNIAEKSKRSFISRLCMSEFFASNPSLSLSNMEKECLYCYLHGFSAKETAILLDISSRTVETHIVHAKNKLNCHSKNELRAKLSPIKKTKKMTVKNKDK